MTIYSNTLSNTTALPRTLSFLRQARFGPDSRQQFCCSISGRPIDPRQDSVVWLFVPPSRLPGTPDSSLRFENLWEIPSHMSSCWGFRSKQQVSYLAPCLLYDLRSLYFSGGVNPVTGKGIHLNTRVISSQNGAWDESCETTLSCLKKGPYIERASSEFFERYRSSFSRGGFRNATFSRCDFRGHDFSGADFQDVAFQNCDLARANFSDTRMDRARFQACSLDFSSFAHASLRESFFSKCHLSEVQFTQTRFVYANFLNCVLTSVNFEEAELGQTNFDLCVLRDLSLTEEQQQQPSLLAHQERRRQLDLQKRQLSDLRHYVARLSERIQELSDAMTDMRIEHGENSEVEWTYECFENLLYQISLNRIDEMISSNSRSACKASLMDVHALEHLDQSIRLFQQDWQPLYANRGRDGSLDGNIGALASDIQRLNIQVWRYFSFVRSNTLGPI